MEITRPEDVGVSSKGLDRITAHLERHYVSSQKIAGCLTLVARRGQVVMCTPQGSMDLERGKPMREDTIFRIYSMTKPITSVALMMLAEEGALQLSDPVHRFIPQWRDLRVYQAGNYPAFLTTPTDRPMTVHEAGPDAVGDALEDAEVIRLSRQFLDLAATGPYAANE